MSRKIKKYIIIVLILFISIGFAILTTNLGITTNLSFRNNVYDIHFENISVLDTSSSINNVVSIEDTTTISFSTILTKPTDFLEFTFYVVNSGTIDAQLNAITTNLTDEQRKYISYNFKYDIDNTEVKVNDYLYIGQARKIRAHFEYNYEIESLYPDENLSTTLTLKYIQPQSTNTTVWNYEYSGTPQSFIVPKTGTYKIELWGAQGGTAKNDNDNNYAGYTAGKIQLDKNEKIYVYVGSAGKTNTTTSNVECEFNGGGTAKFYYDKPTYIQGVGGGATDVRLVGGNWDNFESLKSRIMVAGGSGGTLVIGSDIQAHGGIGGGINGYQGVFENSAQALWGENGTGGTQIAGGYSFCNQTTYGCKLWGDYYDNFVHLGLGGFGYGGTSPQIGAAGGGSGYFGGGSSLHSQGGGGGSSYISGHTGCVSITENSTSSNIIFVNDSNGVACNDSSSTGYNSAGYNIDDTCSKHYSGKIFTDTVMIDGRGYQWTTEVGTNIVGMPTHDGTGTMTGNTGNGFAKITFIG